MADGIIIIDKPQDWTSMDVCAKLRDLPRKRHRPRRYTGPHGDRCAPRFRGPGHPGGGVCLRVGKGI